MRPEKQNSACSRTGASSIGFVSRAPSGLGVFDATMLGWISTELATDPLPRSCEALCVMGAREAWLNFADGGSRPPK
jgi:hypothetical protein